MYWGLIRKSIFLKDLQRFVDVLVYFGDTVSKVLFVIFDGLLKKGIDL